MFKQNLLAKHFQQIQTFNQPWFFHGQGSFCGRIWRPVLFDINMPRAKISPTLPTYPLDWMTANKHHHHHHHPNDTIIPSFSNTPNPATQCWTRLWNLHSKTFGFDFSNMDSSKLLGFGSYQRKETPEKIMNFIILWFPFQHWETYDFIIH